jgi:hypothetical protein
MKTMSPEKRRRLRRSLSWIEVGIAGVLFLLGMWLAVFENADVSTTPIFGVMGGFVIAGGVGLLSSAPETDSTEEDTDS